MKFPFLHMLFYVGLAILFVGVLFKIQHWPGGANMQNTGLLMQLVFTVLTCIEIFTSKKANSQNKIFWGLFYIAIIVLVSSLLPLIFIGFAFLLFGNLYLHFVRKKFLPTRREMMNSEFDSF